MDTFTIIGDSNTGKTRLIQQLVPEFKKRGHSVAVIKHCPHGYNFDLEGKDSLEYTKAGADGVALISPDQLVVFQQKAEKASSIRVALEYFRDVDIILVEGFRKEKGLEKIEVLRKGKNEKVKGPLEDLIAVVSDGKVDVDKPVFHPDQISELANFLESRRGNRKSHVVLEVDGISIPANPFVQKMLQNVVLGMMTSLEGVPENPEHITLSVTKRGKKSGKT
jgi:molybdopterin-guanine dinucleotide biosynthesis protein MobB